MQIQKKPTNKQNEKTTTKNNQTKIEIILQTNKYTNKQTEKKTNNQTKIEIILFAGGSQTWFVFKFICHQMKTTVNSLSDRGSIATHFDSQLSNVRQLCVSSEKTSGMKVDDQVKQRWTV